MAQQVPGRQTVPAASDYTAYQWMTMSKRWLIASPDKVPYYADGTVRRGQLDTAEDVARLATYREAKDALVLRPGWTLGFALGPDGTGYFWQGIDFDDVEKNHLGSLANVVPGYVELSPSGLGAHSIGYGRPYAALGANHTGAEAYSGGRYFTVTEHCIRDGALVCLADFVEQVLAARHGEVNPGKQGSASASTISIEPRVVAELRAALLSMLADDYHLWIRMGLALRELGDVGRALWMEWSSTSSKFNAKQAALKWETFVPKDTGYPAVFAEAQKGPWLNPASKAAQLPKVTSTAVEFQDRNPKNFLTSAVAPELDSTNVPSSVADFAQGFSAAHGFDRGGLVLAAIAAAAAMLDDEYVLEAKPGWRISPRLWVVLIGKSATGKSPTIKAATAALKAKHMQLVAAFKIAFPKRQAEDGERPPEPALFTSDSTIEALSDKLSGNPRGMLMLTEEFAAWIGAINSPGRGDAAKNRGGWLQLYDGGTYQIDRIIRGSIQVPNWGASVLTATTPSALADHMRHLPEDGLIQRFIPIILGPRDFNADGDARPALASWKDVLLALFDMTPGVVTFSPEAQMLFRETEMELGKMAGAADDISSAFASHIGKHSEMIARVALVFHALEDRTGRSLSKATLAKAVRLMAQVRKHAAALYGDVLGRSEAMELARSIARSLAASDPAMTQSIGTDWMTQHCRAFSKTDTDRVRRQAIQLLEDFDWLKDISTRTYHRDWNRAEGRTTISFFVTFDNGAVDDFSYIKAVAIVANLGVSTSAGHASPNSEVVASRGDWN